MFGIYRDKHTSKWSERSKISWMRIKREDHDFRCEVELIRYRSPVEISADSEIVRCISQAAEKITGAMPKMRGMVSAADLEHQKIYEVDPLTCPKCSEKMKVISVNEDQDVIKKILKHLGLWEVKPRPPPRNAKSQLLSTELHIDSSDSLDVPSDSSLYHLAFIQNSRYLFGAEERVALPLCFKGCSELSC